MQSKSSNSLGVIIRFARSLIFALFISFILILYNTSGDGGLFNSAIFAKAGMALGFALSCLVSGFLFIFIGVLSFVSDYKDMMKDILIFIQWFISIGGIYIGLKGNKAWWREVLCVASILFWMWVNGNIIGSA